MTGWRTAATLLAAGFCAAAAGEERPYFGAGEGTAAGIVTISSHGRHVAEISVNGAFAGYTPATLRLPAGTSEVVASLTEWRVTRYVFRMTAGASGVRLLAARADAPANELPGLCDPVNARDRAGAIAWAGSIGGRERQLTWLDVPGPVRGGRCRAAPPWFGSAQYRDLLITSVPAGAMVTFEGRQLGPTPLQTRVLVQPEAVRISASRSGFLTAAATVRGDQITNGQTLRLSLREAR